MSSPSGRAFRLAAWRPISTSTSSASIGKAARSSTTSRSPSSRRRCTTTSARSTSRPHRKAGVPATNPPFIQALVAGYNSAPDARRDADFGGQGIAFAPAKIAGDTTLRAASLSFGALDAAGWPRFLPGMTTADVDVPDARNLTGQATPSRIAFEPSFLAGTGDVIGNASDVFARLVTKSPLALPKEKTGGLVAPNLDISGLSRALGPVGGDVGKMVAGQFRPLDIFGDVTILGGIKLSAILRDLDFGYLDKVGTQVPNLKSVRLRKAEGGHRDQLPLESRRLRLG